MLSLTAPTIIFPNGGESIFSKTVEVQWDAPAEALEGLTPIWYELLFTDSWEHDKQNEWIQIASVPSSATKFLWTVPFTVRGNRCRFAIRSRNAMGVRTPLNISADNFSIQERNITSPAVISPATGESYHQYVPFILDHASVLGTYSQRAMYQIYYSSQSNNTDWTVVRENVVVGCDPFVWDIRDLPPGSDYSVKVVLQDDKGNSSTPVYINSIKVSPLDYFLLDTTPPKGKITIQTNSEFIKNRDLVLKLTAFDETTDVKSVIISQTFGGVTTAGTEQEMANVKTWYIKGTGDGRACISGIFKDYGGNIIDDSLGGQFFRTYLSDINLPVTAFLVTGTGSKTTFYTTFGGDVPTLYINKSFWLDLPEEANALIYYSALVYVCTKSVDNIGAFRQLIGSDVPLVYQFTGIDSVVTANCVYNGVLYLGLQTGDLYAFNGTTMTLVTSFESQVEKMFTDGNVLLIFLENDSEIQVYDGTSFQIVSAANGSIQI